MFKFHLVSPTDVKPHCAGWGLWGGWWVRGSWWWDDFSSLHFGLDGVHHLGVGDTEVNLDFTSFF